MLQEETPRFLRIDKHIIAIARIRRIEAFETNYDEQPWRIHIYLSDDDEISLRYDTELDMNVAFEDIAEAI